MINQPSKAPDLIVLFRPWGLLGSDDQRQELRAPTEVISSGSVAPLLFSRDNRRVFVGGREHDIELFIELNYGNGPRHRIWDIPILLDDLKPQTLRFPDWDCDAVIDRQHRLSRPPTGAQQSEETNEENQRGILLLAFLQMIVARMQDFDSALKRQQDPWKQVQELWLDPKKPRDPTKDVIARHAEKHGRNWDDIAEHPRRLLNRSREFVTLSRVQELDVQCMRWLSRQPGRSLAERAGARQHVLALARRESRDTLENRVFRDLMVRSVAAARSYQDVGSYQGHSKKMQLVNRYGRRCRNLEGQLAEQGVSRQVETVQPNYVLLHDSRYSTVWRARNELIQRERILDDLWRWQHRSWTEFCKSVVAAGMLWMPDADRYFASPLVVMDEHYRGQWIAHDDPMIVIANPVRDWITELLSANSNSVPSVNRQLCASFWLRQADAKRHTPRLVPVWAIHGLYELDLDELVASAEEALRGSQGQANISGGLVLASTVEPKHQVQTVDSAIVCGVKFSPYSKPLTDALDALQEILPKWVNA